MEQVNSLGELTVARVDELRKRVLEGWQPTADEARQIVEFLRQDRASAKPKGKGKAVAEAVDLNSLLG